MEGSAQAQSVALPTRSWGLFGGVALLMLGNGLQGSLLSVRAEDENFGSTVSGLILAMNFVGFLVGAGVGERAVQRVGHIRVFAALASIGSTVALLAAVWVHPVPWAASRFAWGLCLAGLLVVSESWLSVQTTNATRGRLLATYMVIVTGSIAVGHLLVTSADTNGFGLFILASVFVSMALVPVALTRAGAPALQVPKRLGLRKLLSIVPTGVVVAFLNGCATGTLSVTSGVYAAAIGESPFRVALFIAIPMFGSVLMQIPLGRLSDVVPRRLVILGTATAAGVLCLVMLFFVERGSLAGLPVMFGIGCFAYPLYPLALSYCNDWLDADQITGATTLIVRASGAGAIVGPTTAAVLMGIHLDYFFVVIAASCAIIVAYLLYRIATVRGEAVPSVKEQGRFHPFPARASQMAAVLVPRRIRNRQRHPAGRNKSKPLNS